MARATITDAVELELLTKSKCRCALCFGLETDLKVKQVQIAHINRNSADNSYENLAALCLPHHDDYDSNRRQTKSFKPEELRDYRNRLYDVLEKRDKTIVGQFLEVSQSGSRIVSETTNALRLGEITEAFDEDSSRSPPNGIRLTELAKQFIREQGDFVAAREAIKALVDLSWGEGVSSSGLSYLRSSLTTPVASPLVGLVKVLVVACEVDGSFAMSLIRLFSDRAIYGARKDFRNFELGNCPSKFSLACCGIYASIIQDSICRSPEWIKEVLSSEIARLFTVYSIVYALRGFDIPRSIDNLYYSGSGDRVGPGDGFITSAGPAPPPPPGDWPPDEWFACLNLIACQQPQVFAKTIASVPESASDWSRLLRRSEEGALEFDDARRLMTAWATVVGGVFVSGGIAIENESELEQIRSHSTKCHETVIAILPLVKSVLSDEARLIWKR